MTFFDCTADLVGQLNGNGQKGVLHIDAHPMSKISGYATVKLHLYSPLLCPSFGHFIRPSLTSEAGIRYYLGKSLAVECASSLFSSVAYNVRTCSRDRIIYDCLLLDTMLLTSDKSHFLRSLYLWQMVYRQANRAASQNICENRNSRRMQEDL